MSKTVKLAGSVVIQLAILLYTSIINIQSLNLPMISDFFVNLDKFANGFTVSNVSLTTTTCPPGSFVHSSNPGFVDEWCLVIDPPPGNLTFINDNSNSEVYVLLNSFVVLSNNGVYQLIDDWCGYHSGSWAWLSIGFPFLFLLVGLYMRIVQISGIDSPVREYIDWAQTTKSNKWQYEMISNGLTSSYWVPFIATYCTVDSTKNPIWLAFTGYITIAFSVIYLIVINKSNKTQVEENKSKTFYYFRWSIILWYVITSVWSWTHGEIIFGVLSACSFIYTSITISIDDEKT
jgi:hypothetical protein